MGATTDLVAQLEEAEARYVAGNPESLRLDQQRGRFMPGGNTRTTIHRPPVPLTVVRGEAARRTKADGRDYSYGRRGFIALSLPLGEADVDGFSSAVEEPLLTV